MRICIAQLCCLGQKFKRTFVVPLIASLLQMDRSFLLFSLPSRRLLHLFLAMALDRMHMMVRGVLLIHVDVFDRHKNSHYRSFCCSMRSKTIFVCQVGAVNNRWDSRRDLCFQAVWTNFVTHLSHPFLQARLSWGLCFFWHSTLQYRTDLQAIHVFNFISSISAMPQEAQTSATSPSSPLIILNSTFTAIKQRGARDNKAWVLLRGWVLPCHRCTF